MPGSSEYRERHSRTVPGIDHHHNYDNDDDDDDDADDGDGHDDDDDKKYLTKTHSLQLWVRTKLDESPYPLIGHEIPLVIKVSYHLVILLSRYLIILLSCYPVIKVSCGFFIAIVSHNMYSLIRAI